MWVAAVAGLRVAQSHRPRIIRRRRPSHTRHVAPAPLHIPLQHRLPSPSPPPSLTWGGSLATEQWGWRQGCLGLLCGWKACWLMEGGVGIGKVGHEGELRRGIGRKQGVRPPTDVLLIPPRANSLPICRPMITNRSIGSGPSRRPEARIRPSFPSSLSAPAKMHMYEPSRDPPQTPPPKNI